MKTLEQIAEAAGVTKAAIYKRFQSYGLTFNQIKAEKQGRAKVYGDDVERLIILMFQPDEKNGKVESSVERNGKEQEAKIQELQGIVENLQVERKAAEELKEKAEARATAAEEKAKAAEEKAGAETARAERAEAQAEALLQQVDKLTDAIRAAEAVQAAQLARLPAATQEKEKGGIFDRIKRRIRGGEKK